MYDTVCGVWEKNEPRAGYERITDLPPPTPHGGIGGGGVRNAECISPIPTRIRLGGKDNDKWTPDPRDETIWSAPDGNQTFIPFFCGALPPSVTAIHQDGY